MELRVPSSVLSPLSATACSPSSPRRTHSLPPALSVWDVLKLYHPSGVTLLPEPLGPAKRTAGTGGSSGHRQSSPDVRAQSLESRPTLASAEAARKRGNESQPVSIDTDFSCIL